MSRREGGEWLTASVAGPDQTINLEEQPQKWVGDGGERRAYGTRAATRHCGEKDGRWSPAAPPGPLCFRSGEAGVPCQRAPSRGAAMGARDFSPPHVGHQSLTRPRHDARRGRAQPPHRAARAWAAIGQRWGPPRAVQARAVKTRRGRRSTYRVWAEQNVDRRVSPHERRRTGAAGCKRLAAGSTHNHAAVVVAHPPPPPSFPGPI